MTYSPQQAAGSMSLFSIPFPIPHRWANISMGNKIDPSSIFYYLNLRILNKYGGLMLDHFFAVTTTSIYEIVAKGIHDGLPSIQKIAVDGPSDISLGQELQKGTMVIIGKIIISCVPEGNGITSFEHRTELINTRYWVGNTSHIVALFETAEEARECFKHKYRQIADKRWQDNTKTVINKIGPNHPVFYICENPDLQLL